MLSKALIELGLLKGTKSVKLGKAERSISGQFGAASVPSFLQAYLVALISISPLSTLVTRFSDSQSHSSRW